MVVHSRFGNIYTVQVAIYIIIINIYIYIYIYIYHVQIGTSSLKNTVSLVIVFYIPHNASCTGSGKVFAQMAGR